MVAGRARGGFGFIWYEARRGWKAGELGDMADVWARGTFVLQREGSTELASWVYVQVQERLHLLDTDKVG